jgi:hypothetical protein
MEFLARITPDHRLDFGFLGFIITEYPSSLSDSAKN